MRGTRWAAGAKTHKNIGCLSNTGPDPLKNYKATKPAFTFGVSLAGRRWPAYSDIWILPPLIKKQQQKNNKKNVKVGPPLTKLPGSVHGGRGGGGLGPNISRMVSTFTVCKSVSCMAVLCGPLIIFGINPYPANIFVQKCRLFLSSVAYIQVHF